MYINSLSDSQIGLLSFVRSYFNVPRRYRECKVLWTIQSQRFHKARGTFVKNKSSIFIGAIIVAIICIALAVFYAIPGINHPLTSAPATASHWKHVALFAALAVLCVIGALVTRPKKAPIAAQ